MTRQTRRRLDDIGRAIANIRGYVGGSLEKPEIREPVVLDAVLYNLIVIGEAAKNVEAEVRAQVEHVPWSEYAGLRDLLAHQYFRVQRDRRGHGSDRPPDARRGGDDAALRVGLARPRADGHGWGWRRLRLPGPREAVEHQRDADQLARVDQRVRARPG
jgi:uncharacterized protein with HEPN domain